MISNLKNVITGTQPPLKTIPGDNTVINNAAIVGQVPPTNDSQIVAQIKADNLAYDNAGVYSSATTQKISTPTGSVTINTEPIKSLEPLQNSNYGLSGWIANALTKQQEIEKQVELASLNNFISRSFDATISGGLRSTVTQDAKIVSEGNITTTKNETIAKLKTELKPMIIDSSRTTNNIQNNDVIGKAIKGITGNQKTIKEQKQSQVNPSINETEFTGSMLIPAIGLLVVALMIIK